MTADLAADFAGIGPQRNVLGPAPHAAIGFVEHWLFVALQLAAAASTYSRRGS
jgi:hypothetical protein